jgi:hypothetical protein
VGARAREASTTPAGATCGKFWARARGMGGKVAQAKGKTREDRP